MRIVLICLLAFAALVAASPRATRADDGAWTKIYDRPAPQIYGIEMADDTVGLALTAAGILRTSDGGKTWTEPYPIAAFTFGDLAFADGKRAWAVAGSGVIRRTDDAGLTWQSQQSGTTVHLHRIAAVSRDEAWVTGAGEGFSDHGPFVNPPSVLLHTSDGGATWRNEPIAGYGQFVDVAFVGRSGWVVASRCAAGESFDACDIDQRILLRTVDGGRTWEPISKRPGVVPERMQWLDAKLGFATSFVPSASQRDGSGILALYRTGDGGKHWTRIESAPRSVAEIHFASATEGWVSGEVCSALECHIGVVRMADGGATWTVAPDPYGGGEFFGVTTKSLLLGINQIDGPTTNVAMLDLKSLTWSPSESAARQPFWSIDFADREHGYALVFGRLFVTDDGGVTWVRGTAPTLFDSISVSAAGTVWGATICCNNGPPIHRSIDGGTTWQPLVVPFSAVSVIQPFGADDAVATTAEGVFSTADGGSSWRRIDSIPTISESVTFIDPDDAWTLHCEDRTCVDSFRATSDGGATWTLRGLPAGARISQFLTRDIGWATRLDCPGISAACSTVIFSTADGGANWAETGRTAMNLGRLTFAGPLRGWAGVYGESAQLGVAGTNDGGRSWTMETETEGNSGFAGFALARDRAWLLTAIGIQGGSDRTTIYRRDFAPAPAPPPAKRLLRPPDTGSGGAGVRSRAPLFAMVLAGVGILSVGVGVTAKRRLAKD